MKSTLGIVAAGGVAVAFAAAYWLAVRTGAGWLDAQWLFLAALPYNWTMLNVVGVSNFSPDAIFEVAAAGAVDCALAYVAGALAEGLLRGLWRGVGRLSRQT